MKTLAGAFLAAALSIGFAGAMAQTMSGGQPQPIEPKAGEQGPPGTVGAMQNETRNKATSPEDVQRQTEGKPTMAQEAQQGNAGTHPNITKNSPGTVGASPGNTPPNRTVHK